MSLKGNTVLIFQNVKRCLQRSWGGLLETSLTIFLEIKTPKKHSHKQKLDFHVFMYHNSNNCI